MKAGNFSGARRLLALVAFAVLGAQAQAVILFDFRSGGTFSGPNYNNILTMTEDGVTVEISAWAWNVYEDEWVRGHLGRSSTYGLYNQNSPGDGSHTVDNQGWIDYVLFRFINETVKATHAFFFVFGNDGDFDFHSGNFADPTVLGKPDYFASRNNESTGWRDFDADPGQSLLIGAEWFNERIGKKDRDDKFKIKKLKVHRVSVPDSGATVGLLAIGLAGVILVRRRLG